MSTRTERPAEQSRGSDQHGEHRLRRLRTRQRRVCFGSRARALRADRAVAGNRRADHDHRQPLRGDVRDDSRDLRRRVAAGDGLSRGRAVHGQFRGEPDA